VYSIEEALRRLGEYVAFSIAVGSRSMDAGLVASLPALLEPYAPLSPVLDALWQNALASAESSHRSRYASARARWIEVHTKLGQIKSGEMQHVDAIRNAVAYAVGIVEAALGCESAMTWAGYLDRDPYQKVSALYLRKIVRLQQGDWKGAERFDREAELLALQMRNAQMFNFSLPIELEAHALARDLAGVKSVLERLQTLADTFPGWVPYAREAAAYFELIRGNYADARTRFEACIALTDDRTSQRSLNLAVFRAAHVGLAETLLALGEFELARERVRYALGVCDERGTQLATFDLTRVLALSEARLGEFSSAQTRLERLIEEQRSLHVSGLKLGLSFEARAQVAIWAGDQVSFEQFARDCAREYRHGAQCPLAARYEMLLNEARRSGLRSDAELVDFAPTSLMTSMRSPSYDVHTAMLAAIGQIGRLEERTHKALQLVCSARGARAGHLYLVSETQLQLAASFQRPDPPPELEKLVQRQLEAQLTQAATLTQTATATSLVSEPTNPRTDLSVRLAGTLYELVLLRDVANDQITAVAALITPPDQRKPHRAQLLSALAALLTRSA
jgi:tetratricopeptide (TPR) repeat protein